MGRRGWKESLGLLIVILLWTCDAPTTQILVVIDSDLADAPAFRVWVEDEADAGTIAVRTFRVCEGDGPVDAGEALTPGTLRLPFSFGVVPPGEDASRSVRITAWALTDDQGDPLQPPRTEFVRGQRIARVNFVKGRTLVLRLPFSSFCLEDGMPRACPREPEEQTCVLGRCVDVAIDRLEEVVPGEELQDAGIASDAGAERGDARTNDGGAGDAPPPTRETCPRADADTVALYAFEENLDSDGAGPQGEAVGSGLRYGEGPDPGCGRAIRFDGESSVRIPDSDLWDLEEGALDFWFRAASQDPPTAMELISRDDREFGDGHLSIALTAERRIWARLQTASDETTVCSLALDDDWHHVGLSFTRNAITLYVDGEVPQSRGGEVDNGGFSGAECDTLLQSPALGLVGLGNLALPWILGASESGRRDIPLRGEIDHLRFHRVPREFISDRR